MTLLLLLLSCGQRGTHEKSDDDGDDVEGVEMRGLSGIVVEGDDASEGVGGVDGNAVDESRMAVKKLGQSVYLRKCRNILLGSTGA